MTPNPLSLSNPDIQKRNFRNVQIDAIGVSIANVAAPFLPVFLTRLGASNFQVGLLSSMPGITGLVLALVVGRFLQTRRNIVPWFSLARLMVFFDELMKTMPPEYSATFVSLAQSMQYLSVIIAPMLGTWLAGYIGLGGALLLSAGLRLLGFVLFLRPDRYAA